MLVEKGANLSPGDENILHVIMKRKFKDTNKKKKFIKQLSNRWQLTQSRDKNDKLPIDYEVDNEIKNYYAELFKPKLKIAEKEKEKQHHIVTKSKDKDTTTANNLKDKESKKKHKEEEQKIVN